ncbi:hypothetical protein [Bradyrhizobium sp.]|uniref:hypothetical protein n=1 Tax=Bradyrhizobium sp. TaxID=376 RepID=UPI0039E2C5A1
MAKPSPERTRMPAYPPISKAGYEALCSYLDQDQAYWADPSKPDPSLLWVGIPQGSILALTPALGIQVKDTGPEGALRSPRHVDPETVVAIRLLLLAGGSFGLNRKNMDQPSRKDYPHLRWCIAGQDYKVPLLRLIADTQAGYQTSSGENHYYLRRADIPDREAHRPSFDLTQEGKPTKSPYLDRDDAIDLACRLLCQNADKLDFKVTPEELRRRIAQAFALLDNRPLKQPS